MFTVEMDDDGGRSILVTTIDQSGNFDDVEVHLYDDTVFIKQVDDADLVQLITMSPQQFFDIMSSWNCTEGAYRIEIRRPSF